MFSFSVSFCLWFLDLTSANGLAFGVGGGGLRRIRGGANSARRSHRTDLQVGSPAISVWHGKIPFPKEGGGHCVFCGGLRRGEFRLHIIHRSSSFCVAVINDIYGNGDTLLARLAGRYGVFPFSRSCGVGYYPMPKGRAHGVASNRPHEIGQRRCPPLNPADGAVASGECATDGGAQIGLGHGSRDGVMPARPVFWRRCGSGCCWPKQAISLRAWPGGRRCWLAAWLGGMAVRAERSLRRGRGHLAACWLPVRWRCFRWRLRFLPRK